MIPAMMSTQMKNKTKVMQNQQEGHIGHNWQSYKLINCTQ
jgi:hypothetical protein